MRFLGVHSYKQCLKLRTLHRPICVLSDTKRIIPFPGSVPKPNVSNINYTIRCFSKNPISTPDYGAKRVALGTSDYKEYVQSKVPLVDKSLFIKDILDNYDKATLIARPRRFGKTLNMSMLYYFLSNQNWKENRKLFKDKKISRAKTLYRGGDNLDIDVKSREEISCMHYQGKFPVIYFSFNALKEYSYDDTIKQIARIVTKLYKQHDYLKESKKLTNVELFDFETICSPEFYSKDSVDTVLLKNSIRDLSHYLHKHYNQRVIILIDEYDVPLTHSFLSAEPFIDKLRLFMEGFLGGAMKDNSSLRKGLMTGVLQVSLMNLFSGSNNVIVRSMLRKNYQDKFGFTEEETIGLINSQAKNMTEDEKKAIIKTAKKWYNGYQIGSTLLYNPWSVISFIKRKFAAERYWAATGEHSMLGRHLLSSKFNIHSKIKTLLGNFEQGKSMAVPIDVGTIYSNLDRSEGAIWGLLLFSGYLKVTGGSNGNYEVCIPNLEIKKTYLDIISTFLSSDANNVMTGITQGIIEGDLENFEIHLRNFFNYIVSYHDLTSENAYHLITLTLLSLLREQYDVRSNRESGHGRYDIMLCPKDKSKVGYIFELKRLTSDKEMNDLMDSIEEYEENLRITGLTPEFREEDEGKLREYESDLRRIVSPKLRMECGDGIKQIKENDYYAELKARDVSQIIFVSIACFRKYMKMLVKNDI